MKAIKPVQRSSCCVWDAQPPQCGAKAAHPHLCTFKRRRR